MPSIVTHYLFAEEVKEKTSKNIQKQLIKANDLYHVFSQSFDNLFYYNLFSIKNGKKIRNFGNIAQREQINNYFKNLILSIKELNMEKNQDALAYLYGSITHYLLDSICHPFVIYQAGWMDEKNPNYEYRGNHEKIEVSIDAIYWKEKKGKELYKESLGNELLPKITFSKDLKKLIESTYQKTFHKNNMGNIYELSTKQGHNIIKYFVTDHLGLKKRMYQIVDIIFKKNSLKYQYLSFYYKHPNKIFLNRNHEEWCNPVNDKIKSNESFDDLYQKALQKALNIFNLTDQVLQNRLNLDIYLHHLGNNSYITGLDWNLPTKMIFFKKNNL